MNTILIAGDMLYKKVQEKGQFEELLQFTDLPEFIMYRGSCFTIRSHNVRFGSISKEGGIDGLGMPLESGLNAVFSISRQKNACIVIVHSAAIAIKYHQDTATYFVFDSHSRGVDGLYKPEGQAVLSGFVTLQDPCSFLRSLFFCHYVELKIYKKCSMKFVLFKSVLGKSRKKFR